MKVDLSKETQVEVYDRTAELVSQLCSSPGFDVLLVSDAPVDVPVSDHR